MQERKRPMIGPVTGRGMYWQVHMLSYSLALGCVNHGPTSAVACRHKSHAASADLGVSFREQTESVDILGLACPYLVQ